MQDKLSPLLLMISLSPHMCSELHISIVVMCIDVWDIALATVNM